MVFKASVFAAFAAAALAQETRPTDMYVVEPPRVGEERLVGGKYTQSYNLCNGQPVWRRVDRDNVPITDEEDQMFIWLNDEEYWAIGHYACESVSDFRTLIKATDTASGNLTYPIGMDWSRNLRGMWILEQALQVRSKGCSHPRGCLQLECREPEEDYQQCSDCELRGAVIHCDGEDDGRRIALYIVLGLVALGVLVFAAVLLWRNFKKPYTNEDVAEISYKLGLNIGRYYWFVFAAIMFVAVLLITVGLPFAKVQEGGKYGSDWAPEGGRLERELEFMDTWTSPKSIGTRMYVMLGNEDGGNVMTQKMAMTLLDIMQQIYDLKHPINYGRHDGKPIKGDLSNNSQIHVSLQDLCMALGLPVGSPHPFEELLPLVPSLKPITMETMPCFVPSVLDCFFEGGWLFDPVVNGTFPPLKEQSRRHKNFDGLYTFFTASGASVSMAPYDDRPTLYNASQDQFKERVRQWPEGCFHHTFASTRSLGYMFGSVEYDSEQKPVSAQKMMALVQTLPAERVVDYKVGLHGVAERDVEDAILDWYDKVSDLLEAIDDDDERYPGLEVTVFMSHSPTKMFEEITRARTLQLVVGIAVVYVVAVLSQWSWSDRSKSLVRAAIIGTTMVIISNLSGYGFVALLGVELNHAMLQALPFVALGLGVDDMFLLMHYYRSIDPRLPVEKAIAQLFKEGGMSVTLTSVCNAVSFFAGTVLPIPALRDFLLAAGIMVVFNYFIMVYAFPAVLAMEHKWRLEALEQENNEQNGAGDEEAKDSGSSDAQPEKKNEEEAAVAKQEGEEKQEEEEEEKPKHCPPSHDCYIAFLQRKSTMYSQTVFMFLNIAIAVTVLMTFGKLDFGLSRTDLTPRGSYLARGFEDIEEHVLSQRQEHRMIINGDAFDLVKREGQLRAIQFEQLIAINKWTNDTAYNRNTKFFIPMMHQYMAEIRSEKSILDASGLKTLPWNYSATRGELWWIKDDLFYPMYHGWRNPEVIPLRSSASQLTDGFGHDWGVDSYHKENHLRMFYFPYSLNKAVIDSTDAWLEHVDDMQDICDSALGEGMAFPEPTSEYLNVMEFKSLLKNFWTAAAISLVVIFTVCLLFAISLRGALLVTAVSGAGMIEVAAAAMVFGLEFSSLVAVTLLMSIGMFVEFSAHVVIAYEAHPGTRLERQATAVRRTFIPVLEGGVSSVLSFVLLAFSEFPYVFKYFFFIFFVVILVGMNHGLLLLPAMLGVLGAEDEEKADDVSQREPLCISSPDNMHCTPDAEVNAPKAIPVNDDELVKPQPVGVAEEREA